MISTVFEKNRLSRPLKPIVGKSTPGYMVEKRHKFGEMTHLNVILQLLSLRTFLLSFVKHAAKLTWMPQLQDIYFILLNEAARVGVQVDVRLYAALGPLKFLLSQVAKRFLEILCRCVSIQR